MAQIRLTDFGNRVAALAPRANVPRAAFVRDDGGTADALMQVATSALRQERQQAEEVERENARVGALVAQGSLQNGLTGLNDEIARGLEDGSVPREEAEKLWNNKASKIIAEGLKSASPEHQPALQAQAIAMSDRLFLGVQRAVAKRGQQEIAGGLLQYGELMERYAVTDLQQATQQYEMAVDTVGPKAGMTPLQIEQAKQVFRERGASNSLTSKLLAVQNDPVQIERLEAEIAANAVLNPEKKTALLSQAATVKQRAWATTASDLEIAVRRGKAGYAEIENAMKAGVITPAKRTELTLGLDLANRKLAEGQASERGQIARVHSALEGRGMFLDFRSDKDRKAVDLFYERVFRPSIERAQLDPAQALQEAVTFTARTGIMPSPMRQVIRGALRAGDAAEPGNGGIFNRLSKAQAADILDRLKDANPQVLNDFSEQDIALGNSIQTYVRAGVAPLQAVALAEKNLSVPDAEREARKTRYVAEKAPTKNLKRLESELTGFRWFSPNMPAKLPDALTGEFERLTREEFVRSGELEAAQSTALDHLRRVWGVTRVDGKPRWMKYAPETVFQVPGEPDGAWIREQLYAEVSKNALFDGKPDLTLAADSLTARSDSPSYVVLNRKEGVLEPLLGADGRPLRFRPDYLSSPAGARRQKAMDHEREMAAQILDTQPDPGPSNVFTLTPGGAVTSAIPRPQPKNSRRKGQR